MKHVVGVVAAILLAATTSLAGDGFYEGTLKPGLLSRVEVPATAHIQTSIRVVGNGGDLDCYLYHGKEEGMAIGKFIKRDTSNKDGCDLTYTPQVNETLTLLVQNVSQHDEHYAVTTH